MLEHSDLKPPQRARRSIHSVETGLRVLSALAAAGGPTTLTALGTRSGLSPSQTHRYLQSLIASGMAVQDATARYDLGPGVIRIGIAALARANTLGAAEAALARFVEATGWTALLAVWSGAVPVCVRWLAGRPTVMTNFGVGSELPLLSAAGSVFRAFLPAGELAAAGVPPLPAAVAAQIRDGAAAHQDGVVSPGLRAVAVPVFDLQGRPVLAAVAIAAAGTPHDADAWVAGQLREACRTATQQAGGSWP